MKQQNQFLETLSTIAIGWSVISIIFYSANGTRLKCRFNALLADVMA
jgi:hypothetical protein